MQRLKLFGGIGIETEDGPLTGRAVQRRRLALLALLAAARTPSVGRDRLAALLWPDADPENGRRFLSDSVYRINQALGGEAIVAAADGLRLDRQRLPSDVADFEEALSQGDHARAAALHAGPFLDGFHLPDAGELERWIEGERDRLGRAAAGSLESLAESAENEGRWIDAAGWWRRLAAADPYSSRVALRLMRALDGAGERAAAIQHARIHEALLRAELDLEPDPAVAELAERLRTMPPAPAAPQPSPPSPPTHPPEPADAGTPTAAMAAIAAPTHVAPAPPPARWRWTVARVVIAAAMLAIVGGAFWWNARDGSASPPAAAPGAIAVLPFANLSGDAGDEYLSDGITEEIIAMLARADGMQVASRSSVFAYKRRAGDVREIARQLGVATVLEGSVRRSGSRLRITTQLVDAGTGYELWAETFDRETADLFAVQEEIAHTIVDRLRGATGTSRGVPLAERSPRDAEAYDLYLKGRYAWHRRTRDGIADAIDYFGRATARAPGFARAHVGLADAYAVAAFYDFVEPRAAYRAAERATMRALALDSTLAAAHANLGYVRTYHTLDWVGAERSFRRALALDRDYSTASQWYGNLLTVSGRFDEAADAFRAAQRADPLSLVASAGLGWVLYHAGRHAEAAEQCARTIAMEPTFMLAHLWGGQSLEAAGRRAEARAWLARADSLSGGTPLTRLAVAHLLAGDPATRDSARAIVESFEARRARGEYLPAYEIATVRLALGDRAGALRWLRRTVDDGSHSRAFFRIDRHLAPLRGDPEFERLVREVIK